VDGAPEASFAAHCEFIEYRSKGRRGCRAVNDGFRDLGGVIRVGGLEGGVHVG